MDAVLNWLWQGGVVAVALGLMLFSLERASANVRYVVCWAAALFVIALPALPSLPAIRQRRYPTRFAQPAARRLSRCLRPGGRRRS